MITISDKIKEQEDRKKFLGSLLKSAITDMQKPKRKTAKQQVRQAEIDQLEKILSVLRDKKRSIPKDWENGFNSAISLIEGMKK